MRVAHLFRPRTERENSYVTSTYSVTSIDLISSYRGNCGLETFYLFNKVLFIYVCVCLMCVHVCMHVCAGGQKIVLHHLELEIWHFWGSVCSCWELNFSTNDWAASVVNYWAMSPATSLQNQFYSSIRILDNNWYYFILWVGIKSDRADISSVFSFNSWQNWIS